MASPAIRSSIVTSGTTASATPVINLPATVVAGDTLIVQFRVAVAGAIGWPGGAGVWNELVDGSPDGADDQHAIAWKKADGTEGGTTITLSCTSGKFGATAWAISGAADPTVQPPELSTVAIGTTPNQPDATAVTPTGGSKDYLFGSLISMEGEATPSQAPTGYALGFLDADSGVAGAVTTNVRLAGAWKQATAASDDPGPWTYTGTLDDWSCYAIAVHPASTDVTVGLTGIAATCAAGALGLLLTMGATGVAATGSPGTLTPLPRFDDYRQAIIDGFDSAQAEAAGWDVKKALIPVTAVVRTSDTVVTITLPALSGYDITATETITGTIPAGALVGGAPLVATPTITIDPVAGGVTEALTGVASTGSPGSVTPSLAVPLVGESATGAVGTLTASTTVPMPGEAATGAVGSVTPSTTLTLSGEAATTAVGTLTETHDSTTALTGVSATSAVDSLSPSTTVPLTGESATGAGGTVGTTGGDAFTALSGVSATGSVGTLAPSPTIPITGETATASVGTLPPETLTAVTGTAAASTAGMIVASGGDATPDITVPLNGVSATGEAGTVAPGTSRSLTGTTATTAVGSLTQATARALTSVSATTAVGTMTAVGGTIVIDRRANLGGVGSRTNWSVT